jgi:hypothetical protein
MANKGALNHGDRSARDVSERIYGAVDAETDLDDIPATSRKDGMIAVVLGDSSLWIFDGDSSATEVTGSVRQPASGDGRWIRTGATLSETNARIASSVADTTALQAISAANRSNGQIVVKRDTDTIWTFDSASSAGASDWVVVPSAGTGRWLRNHVSLADLSSTANAKGATLVGIEDAGSYFAATTVEGALQETRADLAATTNGNGASLVGIEDAGTFTTAANVEAALAEIYQHLKSTQASVPLSLFWFRETSGSSDVGDITANGGILASDTTPILRGDAAESQEISWATGNTDQISIQISLPANFDGTADVTVRLWVYSGATDAATFTVESSWDGGALVTDTADDTATKSASKHAITATIAAADIPDTAAFVSINLIPGAHAADAIQLVAARIEYKSKLLTS